MAATLKAVMSDPVPVEVEPIGLDELEGSVFSRIFNALGLSFNGSGASHKPDPLKSVIYKLLEKRRKRDIKALPRSWPRSRILNEILTIP